MNEERQDGGVLSDGGPPANAGTGIDPFDAVAAIAGAREAAGTGEAARQSENGITVETRVTLDAAKDGGDADGYGEFAWPDGFAADPGALAKFVPLARKLGLPKNSAQELAGLYAELEQERSAAQAECIAKNNAEWLREIQAHPEFGGRNLEATAEGVAGLMRRHGSPLLLAQVRQMNIQNWPEMFYFLARLARASAEDCSPSSAGGHAARSTAQLLFPGMK